jgi:hypothetical protein
MENLTELNYFELTSIEGGTEAPTFAYRVGQTIRFIGYCGLPGNTYEYAWDMTFGVI